MQGRQPNYQIVVSEIELNIEQNNNEHRERLISLKRGGLLRREHGRISDRRARKNRVRPNEAEVERSGAHQEFSVTLVRFEQLPLLLGNSPFLLLFEFQLQLLRVLHEFLGAHDSGDSKLSIKLV